MSLIKVGCYGLASRKDMINVKKVFIWTKDMVKTMHIKVTISKNVLDKSRLLWSGIIIVKKDFIWIRDMVKTRHIEVTKQKNIPNKSLLYWSG